MYNGFSATNINLNLGNFSVPKTTFDFKATSALDTSKAFQIPDLGFANKFNFDADFSNVFSSGEDEQSASESSSPSTLPYIWKYQ